MSESEYVSHWTAAVPRRRVGISSRPVLALGAAAGISSAAAAIAGTIRASTLPNVGDVGMWLVSAASVGFGVLPAVCAVAAGLLATSGLSLGGPLPRGAKVFVPLLLVLGLSGAVVNLGAMVAALISDQATGISSRVVTTLYFLAPTSLALLGAWLAYLLVTRSGPLPATEA